MNRIYKNNSGKFVAALLAVCICTTNLISAATDVYNDNLGTQGSQDLPAMTIDGNGKTTCVWESLNSSGHLVIQAATKASGQTTWTANTPNPISGNGSPTTTQTASQPILATNANGYSIAVWGVSDTGLGTSLVYSATKAPSSNNWINLTRLSTTTEQALGDYKVVIDNAATPHITVTWSSFVNVTDTFTRIRSASSNDNGITWN